MTTLYVYLATVSIFPRPTWQLVRESGRKDATAQALNSGNSERTAPSGPLQIQPCVSRFNRPSKTHHSLLHSVTAALCRSGPGETTAAIGSRRRSDRTLRVSHG